MYTANNAGARASTRSSSRSSAPVRLPSDRRRPGNTGGQLRGAGRALRNKKFIHPSKFIKTATVTEKSEYVSVNTFSDFSLDSRILANVLAKGYNNPSPIQDKTIPIVMQGRDLIGIANTGTGKTAAFALPLIHDLIHAMDHHAIIMAPTRELAQQIQEECLAFSKNCGLRTALLIGGASMNMQIRDLRRNPRLVIGTPGRIKDHLQQRTLSLSGITTAVLDEFDRMLDMGFIRDITSIFSAMPTNRQTLFFSATMEGEIEKHVRSFSHDAVTVSVRENVTVDSVNQDVVYYRAREEKIDKLHDLLIAKNRGKTIIFDDTKHSVERLCKVLVSRGFKADRIHGNKSQAQRTRAIKRLKENEIDILVATDVAARGIDVADISHVINYSQPNTYEDYVHRIGRTGRAGNTGNAYTFLEKE
ncbi:MAG TPA: DEAD/DEAH box helicase [Treponemataceae bacterium]|nr:DEAD/DEAH box helicase [Treponemataceae bacterium]